jgi:hypothetical protein
VTREPHRTHPTRLDIAPAYVDGESNPFAGQGSSSAVGCPHAAWISAVEIYELLERERRTDHVAGHILDGLFVLERDRLTDVRREARMSPGEELPSEILRDRVSFDETGQQALAEK